MMVANSPSLLNALVKALSDVETADKDAAAIALAKRLAFLMDEAQSVATEFDGLEFEKISGDMYRRLERVEAKVKAEQVTNDLAPKLLAILLQFGMTPAARAGGVKGGEVNVGSSSGPADALRALRDAHEARRAAASSG